MIADQVVEVVARTALAQQMCFVDEKQSRRIRARGACEDLQEETFLATSGCFAEGSDEQTQQATGADRSEVEIERPEAVA